MRTPQAKALIAEAVAKQGGELQCDAPWRHDVRAVFQAVAPDGMQWVDNGADALRLDWFGDDADIRTLVEQIECGTEPADE